MLSQAPGRFLDFFGYFHATLEGEDHFCLMHCHMIHCGKPADLVELEVFTTDKDRAQQFLSIPKRYTDFSQLTTPMINEFVDKILVHAPEKIDGERTMEIEIYLKFIGKFEIPMPEPTPEELADEEKVRKKRAAERAKYERRKERNRQQKLEAERQSQATENADAPEEQWKQHQISARAAAKQLGITHSTFLRWVNEDNG